MLIHTTPTSTAKAGCEARTRPCLCETVVDRGETRVPHSDGFARVCLPSEVSQVPFINFCMHVMTITGVIMSVHSPPLHLHFDKF